MDIPCSRTVLDNGLHVITLNMPYGYNTSTVVAIGTGSRYEPDDLAGLSHFLEHLPFKGTRHWPTPKNIAESVENMGGTIDAFTEREMTVFNSKVSNTHWEKVFPVVFDLVLQPLLRHDDIEKERDIILDELRMNMNNPTDLCGLLMDQSMWPNQSIGRDIGGIPETVREIQRDDLYAYHQQQYVPNNSAVIVSGNVSHQKVVDRTADLTRHWIPGKTAPKNPLIPTDWSIPTVTVNHQDNEETTLNLGFPGVAYDDPDYYITMIITTILGIGSGSRLFQKLREDLGLTYDCHSQLHQYKDCANLIIACSMEPENTSRVASTILQEINGLTNNVTNKELFRAKEYVKGGLFTQIEDSMERALFMATQDLVYGNIEPVNEIIDHVDVVTVDDVSRVSSRIFSNKPRIVVVGPHKDSEFEKIVG